MAHDQLWIGWAGDVHEHHPAPRGAAVELLRGKLCLGADAVHALAASL